ncbi:hypothetical protein Bca4012_064997 [Brassica carinata]
MMRNNLWYLNTLDNNNVTPTGCSPDSGNWYSDRRANLKGQTDQNGARCERPRHDPVLYQESLTAGERDWEKQVATDKCLCCSSF